MNTETCYGPLSVHINRVWLYLFSQFHFMKLDFRLWDDNFWGSFYVSGKLPTYPSSKPAFCPKWEESVNVGLGEGLVGSFPET